MLTVLTVVAVFSAPPKNDSLYQYRIERSTIVMTDGARLAITWWLPTPRHRAERFPALLELLPYRKDDSFYARDYPLYDYFVRRGFLMAKVDIRGTGGSSGALPSREYSEQELDDAVEIIRRLARHPLSNGSVGMWGISWGGFNALQVAMRRPPGLKAILALHASDDLYHDDVRYIDGALHIDPYALQIDHENGLPRTPGYALDSAYFHDRFEAYPWVLTYLKQDVDGPFWRRNALRFHPDAIEVPVYLIGGLLDGYRDTPLRALEYLGGPVKVEIGPWTHDWPDNGTPGPNYEWRARAVRWWNHWLRGEDSGLLNEPPLLVFQRTGHGPDRTLTTTPGRWRFEGWPVAGAVTDTLLLACSGRLVRPGSRPDAVEGCAPGLRYAAGAGVMAGDWWGEPTGDMGRDDAGSLVFDTPALAQPLTILGFSRVGFDAVAGAPLATWTARVEDVGPDGQVALVTGAALNATEYRSPLSPERLEADRTYHFAWDLHFTTWTFQAGHRIRLALSNAQFPMLWPTPYPMTSRIVLGNSLLTLPVVPDSSANPVPDLPPPQPRAVRPGVRHLNDAEPVERTSYQPLTGTTTFEWANASAWSIGRTRYEYSEREHYQTNDRDPSRSSFLGVERHRIRPPGRDLSLETIIAIRSDSLSFHAEVTRRLRASGGLRREKHWCETIPRRFH
jgi:uncharacterized protein